MDVKKINKVAHNYDLQCHGVTGSCIDDWLKSKTPLSEIALLYLRHEKIVIITLEDYIDLVNVWYPNLEPSYVPVLSETKSLKRKDGETMGSGTAYYLVYNWQIDPYLTFIDFEDDDVPIMLYRRKQNEN